MPASAMLGMCLESAHSRSNSRRRSGRNSKAGQSSTRCRIIRFFAPRWSSTRLKASPTTTSLVAWIPAAKSSANGANDSSKSACSGWRNVPDRVAPGRFPPERVVQVQALACELPATHHVPLSRWSLEELRQAVCRAGLVAQISGTTLWRWLHEEAMRPWQHRCRGFPRDPDFVRKAGRIRDLYQRQWQGQALPEDEFVVSTDEQTSSQARRRLHATVPPGPQRPIEVQHEYERKGAWAYLAAGEVHRATRFGRCEARSGIAPVDRLVAQVMKPFEWKFTRNDLAQLMQRLDRHSPTEQVLAAQKYVAGLVKRPT